MRLPRTLLVAAIAVFLADGAYATDRSFASPGHSAGHSAAPAGRAVVFADPSSAPGTGSSAAVPASSGGSRSGRLSVPAAAVPLSSSFDPFSSPPAQVTSVDGHRTVVLPQPDAGSLPKVQAPPRAVTPDAVVMLSAGVTSAQRKALGHLKGVASYNVVDTGTVTLGGAPVVAFGVDPDTFRAFTPPASAGSDQLWRYVKGGSLVSSYDMANDRQLKLGSEEMVTPASGSGAPVQGWLGAIASIGLPGVDMLVDQKYSASLGLTPHSGIVVSAPGMSGTDVESQLQKIFPDGAVELLSPDQFPTVLVGDSLDSATRQRILSAAMSRVGKPYVWGGSGPDVFDCSGLVQWSFRQAGVLMPRVAAEQFLTGDHIPLAAAQPGDLLFWTYDPSDPTYVDHVAIYLGNGLMVVAPHTGVDVQVAQVPTDDFAGAVEVVLQK